jgi:hypothetical protein
MNNPRLFAAAAAGFVVGAILAATVAYVLAHTLFSPVRNPANEFDGLYDLAVLLEIVPTAAMFGGAIGAWMFFQRSKRRFLD